jgi:protein-S-isoprenylcysteine O-methyltransferase Ste14
MEIIYFIWFGICFVCYFIRTVFNVLNYKKSPWAESRKLLAVVYIVMFILWFSWFCMCFNDPIEMDIPDWIGYVGLGSFIMGFALFILSHGKMKGFEDKGKLVTEGIYSKIRNPMYLGFIIWIVGFPIFTRSLITLLSSVIWISFILTWKRLEEKELEKKYENYREYKKRTLF